MINLAFSSLGRLIIYVIGIYIFSWILFWIVNFFLIPVICTAQTVLFTIAEYKAYVDTMFPVTMSVLKLLFLIWLSYWLYKKVTSFRS
jgi:hypothetical protein